MRAGTLLLLAAAAALVSIAAGNVRGAPKVAPRVADIPYIQCQASACWIMHIYPCCFAQGCWQPNPLRATHRSLALDYHNLCAGV